MGSVKNVKLFLFPIAKVLGTGQHFYLSEKNFHYSVTDHSFSFSSILWRGWHLALLLLLLDYFIGPLQHWPTEKYLIITIRLLRRHKHSLYPILDSSPAPPLCFPFLQLTRNMGNDSHNCQVKTTWLMTI